MTDHIFLHEHLILDTCCVINLYATGHIQSILEAIPIPVIIANPIYQASHYIYNGSGDNVSQVREKIDLRTFVEKKLLFLFSPDCEMENAATNIAHTALIDDEEAITYAMALHYTWSLGTDDMQSTTLLIKRAPGIRLLSTLDIIKYWVDTTRPPFPVVKTVLENMRRRALYEPHLVHHLYKWWCMHRAS